LTPHDAFMHNRTLEYMVKPCFETPKLQRDKASTMKQEVAGYEVLATGRLAPIWYYEREFTRGFTQTTGEQLFIPSKWTAIKKTLDTKTTITPRPEDHWYALVAKRKKKKYAKNLKNRLKSTGEEDEEEEEEEDDDEIEDDTEEDAEEGPPTKKAKKGYVRPYRRTPATDAGVPKMYREKHRTTKLDVKTEIYDAMVGPTYRMDLYKGMPFIVELATDKRKGGKELNRTVQALAPFPLRPLFGLAPNHPILERCVDRMMGVVRYFEKTHWP
jgi:hypothetical protein